MRTFAFAVLVPALTLLIPALAWCAPAAEAPGPHAWSPARGPLQAFHARLEEMQGRILTFDDVTDGVPVIEEDFARPASEQQFLAAGDPRSCASWTAWSARTDVAGDLPLVWNPGERQFEIVERRFNTASDATVRFSWYFLRAFEALDPALRKWPSVLSLGAAGLVAHEALSHEGGAITPSELEAPIATVALLSRYEPALLPACFHPAERDRAAACVAALRALAGSGPPVPAAQILDAPIESSFHEKPLRLEDLVPQHAAALELYFKHAAAVGAPALSGALIAAGCPNRYGIPLFAAGAKAAWQRELSDLADRVRADLARRKHAGKTPKELAPASGMAWADPGSLRALMSLATQIVSDKLTPADGRSLTAAEYLTVLRAESPTAGVLALAGTVPSVEMTAATTDVSRASPQPGRLVFERIRRDAADRSAADVQRTERVVVELTDYRPLGSGHPIHAMDEHTPVPVQLFIDGRFEERVLPARDVKAGMRVRGFSGIPPADSDDAFAVEPPPAPTWFRVAQVTWHRVPMALALDFGGAQLVLSLDEAVVMGFGAQGLSWRAAWALDPGADAFHGGQRTRVDTITRIFGERKLVQFSLAPTEPGVSASQCVVYAGESTPVTVEARPLESGLVAPQTKLLRFDGAEVAARDVVANEKRAPVAGETFLAGFYPRPPGAPWTDDPVLSRHPTIAVQSTKQAVQSAYEVELSSGSRLRVGEGSLLLKVTPHGLESCPVADPWPAGSRVASGEAPDGTPLSEEVKSVTKVALSTPEQYILLEMLNLPFVRADGALLGLPTRRSSVFATGVSTGTSLGQPAARASSPGRPAGGTVTLAADGFKVPATPARIAKELPGAPLALWFADLDLLERGAARKVDADYATRFTDVRFDGGALECTAAQELVVKRSGKLEHVRARHLLPGDQVMVVKPGAGSATPAAVTRARPRFMPHGVIAHVVTHPDTAVQSAAPDSLLANGVALAMPVIDGPGSRAEGEPGSGGGAQGTGSTANAAGRESPQRLNETRRAPRATRPPDALVADPIQLPPEGKIVLAERGRELAALFASECDGLPRKLPDTPALRYWKGVLATADARPESLPLGSPDPAAAIAAWFTEVLRRRQIFLDSETHTARLAQVLFLETMTAGWLQELNCRRTAERLGLDALELAVYAGCEHHEPERLRARLGPDLGLLTVLRVPSWIGLAPRSTDPVAPLNQAALNQALDWAQRVGFRPELDRGGGKIALASLLAYWAEVAGPTVDAFWEDLPTPSAAGELGEQALGRDLTAWLSRELARLVAEPPAHPPAPGARPTPPPITRTRLGVPGQ